MTKKMNIVVYCSAQDGLEDRYNQLAATLGQWIGKNGHTLVYGGVKAGLMHVTATAVHEAGGICAGVIPEMFLHRLDPLCDKVVTTSDLQQRKQYMIEHGDVFVILPGGVGTLDEWISTLCVMCIDDDDRRPIIVADLDGLFKDTVRQLEAITHTPFARGKDLTRTLVAHSPDDLLATLNNLTLRR